MKANRILLVAVCLLSLSFCQSQDVSSVNDGMKPTIVRDHRSLTVRIAILAENPAVSVTTLDTSVPSELTYPIHIIERNSDNPSSMNCLLTGSIHGNEPAGAEALLRFAEMLAQEEDGYAHVSFTIIPVQNPYGWIHDTRGAANGEDINRDFASTRTWESQLIRDYLKNRRFDVAIDLHEDPHASGCYIYQYAPGRVSYAPLFVEYLSSMGLPIEDDVSFSILKVENGIIHAPLWGLWYQRAAKQLSSTNWLRLEGIRHTYTVETPTSLDFERRVAIHTDAVRVIIDAAMENIQ